MITEQSHTLAKLTTITLETWGVNINTLEGIRCLNIVLETIGDYFCGLLSDPIFDIKAYSERINRKVEESKNANLPS